MFAKTVTQPLFPSVIWIHDVEPSIAKPLNQRLIASLGRLSPQPPGQSGKGWQTDQVLHEHSEFQDLVKIIKTGSKAVLDKYEIDYGDFEITGCWANMGQHGPQWQPSYLA